MKQVGVVKSYPGKAFPLSGKDYLRIVSAATRWVDEWHSWGATAVDVVGWFERKYLQEAGKAVAGDFEER